VHSINASVGPSPDEATTATWRYQRNQQFSITAVTTSSGSVAERYAYTAYGQPTILDGSGSVLSSSAINNRYTYTGREWDSTVGLYHFRARWMSGLAGRFMGRDPIGYDGSPNNLLQFLLNSILEGIDFDGQYQRNPEGPEWHHNYPKDDKRLKPFWDQFGINPHKEECGCLMLGKDHAKIHPGYQNEIFRRIRDFLDGPPPGELSREKLDQIVKDVQQMKDFKPFFDRSKPACCDYNFWNNRSTPDKRKIWDYGRQADIIEQMSERLRRRGNARSGRALNKLVAAMGVLSAAGGVIACLSGDCDDELSLLVAEAGRIAPNGGLTPSGLSACVGYFSAFNQLGNCMGIDSDVVTHASIGVICAEVYAGEWP
jgi:RHS repeat-associated protein